ncbi:hypothetical protein F4824DRAFT_442620 [Ustulina deusta]|nr:hypothetical protein F4824DRAFT_442620 [Ustulina deusta]
MDSPSHPVRLTPRLISRRSTSSLRDVTPHGESQVQPEQSYDLVPDEGVGVIDSPLPSFAPRPESSRDLAPATRYSLSRGPNRRVWNVRMRFEPYPRLTLDPPTFEQAMVQYRAYLPEFQRQLAFEPVQHISVAVESRPDRRYGTTWDYRPTVEGEALIAEPGPLTNGVWEGRRMRLYELARFEPDISAAERRTPDSRWTRSHYDENWYDFQAPWEPSPICGSRVWNVSCSAPPNLTRSTTQNEDRSIIQEGERVAVQDRDGATVRDEDIGWVATRLSP